MFPKATASLLLVLLLLSACQTEPTAERVPTLKEEIVRYYSVRETDSIAVRDTLKQCFSCNQSDVYDENGRLLEHRFYKGNSDAMFGYEVFEYNDLGQKIGSSYYEGDSLTTKYVYELDERGRVSVGRAYNAATDEMLYGYRYQYNDLGQDYETATLDETGTVYEYYRRTYNEAGVVIAENIEDLNDEPTFRVHYAYRPKADSAWTEQIVYYNDKLSEIRVRERVYFE